MDGRTQREQVWHCAPCWVKLHQETVLDFTTPGTQDALWTVEGPTHKNKRIPVCGPHRRGELPGASLEDLSQMGERGPGGVMIGPAKLVHHYRDEEG